MCGIAGLIQQAAGEKLSARALRMAQSLVHRGPDDMASGWMRKPASRWPTAGSRSSTSRRRPPADALGQRPLRHRLQRRDLQLRGAARRTDRGGARSGWRGHSDTEVLLAAVEALGLRDGARTRRTGMFAFALWDRESAALSLARDRLGEKPLYYGCVGGSFCFGSELKALRAHPQWRPPRSTAARSRCSCGSATCRRPARIYEGIDKLRPGTCRHGSARTARTASRVDTGLLVGARGAAPTRLAGADDARLVDWLDALLRDAVGSQMVADVPLGAFLSGGIDSSSVVGADAGAEPRGR